jgi:SAM-dependent methyltransferase
MTDIEHRVETTGILSPNYSEERFSDEDVAMGKHRTFVGGRWDEYGVQQVEFLTAHGLRPQHKFLDVGCGAFRAGRHLIDLLDAGNYYGIDANLDLLKAGYDVELTDEQRAKLPARNLRANDRFNADFGVRFDMAIAQSVFTHISLNHIRLCLYRLGNVLRPGGKFYATFFEEPARTPLDEIRIRSEGGRPYLSEQNLFWYYRQDMAWAAGFGPWNFRYIGDWGHPRRQMMVEFTRRDPNRQAARTMSDRVTAGRELLGQNLRRARKTAGQGRRWAANRIGDR